MSELFWTPVRPRRWELEHSSMARISSCEVQWCVCFLEVSLNVQGSVRRCFPAEKVRKALCDIKNVFFQKGLHFKLWIDAVRSQKSPRFGGGKRMCSRHVEMRGRRGYWERRFPVLHLFIWKKSQKMLTTDYEFLFNPMQSKSGYCMFWSIS